MGALLEHLPDQTGFFIGLNVFKPVQNFPHDLQVLWALAELLHGAEKSSRVSENLAAIEDFCSRLEVLPYGPKATQHYGAIGAALEKLGQPIGVNDMHIAAHARSEGLVLVTNNMGEFARVPALQAENWVHTAQ